MKKFLIRLACTSVPGARLKFTCAREFVLRDCARARQMLDHYLSGSGQKKQLSTHELLSEDDSVFAVLGHTIKTSLAVGQEHGRQWIHQWQFSQRDWRYALGGLHLDWELQGSQVNVSFVERYDWHPESIRPTQSLHVAARRMEQFGARPFDIIGETAVLPLVGLANSPVAPYVPLKDRLMC